MNKNIPVLFQTLSDIEISDTRFTRVKIWLMHLDENFNGSYFDKDSVSKAIPSLSNTPIMGMIDKASSDFTDHAIEIDFDDNNNIKQTHLTVPFGVIPSENKATFEGRVGDDGVTRTYLTVEGLLWNKWEDAINILNSNNGKIGQSMEITDVDGEFRDDGFFSITDFKFDGACLLGNDVLPAMMNSTVELVSQDVVAEVIREKMGVYTRYTMQEGGDKVDKEKEIKKEEPVEEKLSKENMNSKEDKDAKGAKDSKETKDSKEKEDSKEKQDNKKSTVKDDGKADTKEEATGEPKLTPKKDIPEAEATPADPNSSDSGAKPENTVDKGVLGNIIIGKNYTQEEIDELLEIKEKYEELVEEIRVNKIYDLINSYSSELSDEEIEGLKSDANDKEYEEIEQSIFACIGRKVYTSKKEEKDPVATDYTRISVPSKEDNDEPYGGIIKKANK